MSEVDHSPEEVFADSTEQLSLPHQPLLQPFLRESHIYSRQSKLILGFGEQQSMGNQLPYTEAAVLALSHQIWHSWLC